MVALQGKVKGIEIFIHLWLLISINQLTHKKSRLESNSSQIGGSHPTTLGTNCFCPFKGEAYGSNVIPRPTLLPWIMGCSAGIWCLWRVLGNHLPGSPSLRMGFKCDHNPLLASHKSYGRFLRASHTPYMLGLQEVSLKMVPLPRTEAQSWGSCSCHCPPTKIYMAPNSLVGV